MTNQREFQLSSEDIVNAIGDWIGVNKNVDFGHYTIDVNFICSTKEGISANVTLTKEEEEK